MPQSSRVVLPQRCLCFGSCHYRGGQAVLSTGERCLRGSACTECLAEMITGTMKRVVAADSHRIISVQMRKVIARLCFAECSEMTSPAVRGWESGFSPVVWMLELQQQACCWFSWARARHGVAVMHSPPMARRSWDDVAQGLCMWDFRKTCRIKEVASLRRTFPFCARKIK